MTGQTVTFKRFLVREAYAKNGNAHNPTPTYQWAAYHNGILIASAPLKRIAREIALDHLKTKEAK